MSKHLPAPAVLDDPRWAMIQARDPGADGAFVYAVLTTGVYCRPSCASRPARPEHVRFYATEAEASGAGFRPCKRCTPDLPPRAERQAALIATLCRHIEEAEEPPSLAALAALARLSPTYTQRLFKAVTGVTPRAYAAAHRAERVREALAAGDTVTEALYAAGYASSGRFYAESTARLGMTPSRFRAGGDAETIRFALGECTLGSILVAATARGVCAILLGDEPEPLLRDLERRFPRAALLGADADFEALVARVIALVEAPTQADALPLDIRGTAFQQRVWAALVEIPPGETRTYLELAAAIGAPQAVRAVAQACGANPLAVAIPCHRVIRTGGDLAGYRWGVERKRALLEHERAPARHQHTPAERDATPPETSRLNPAPCPLQPPREVQRSDP